MASLPPSQPQRNRPILWDNEDDSKYTSSSNDYSNRSRSIQSSSASAHSYEQHNDHHNHQPIYHTPHRHYVADENIGTYQDRDIVLKRNRYQWTQQQNNMRKNLRIEDTFNSNWKVPNAAQIQYYDNNRGIVTVNLDQMRVNQHEHKSRPLRYIGAVDIASSAKDVFKYDKACAGLFIFSYPTMRCVYQETLIVELKEPYIAGFLAFREVAHLKQLVDMLRERRPKFIPDVILVDGHGIFHYRRAGLATHLSMEINIPCVGIAKNMLNVDGMNVDQLLLRFNNQLMKKGEFHKIFAIKSRRECIGFALRSNPRHDLIFVSPGNRVSYETSLKLVMLCMDHKTRNNKWNLPLPIGRVRSKTRHIIRDYQQQHAPRCNYENHTRLQIENENIRKDDYSFHKIKQENERLKKENERIKQRNEKYRKFLEKENERLKKENRKLEIKCAKFMKENQDLRSHLDYEWWDCEQTVKWICGIEKGRFRKYKQVLLNSMKQRNIDGRYLPRMDVDDLLKWGVDSTSDRLEIMRKIIELLVKNSTTKGNDEFECEQVEGLNNM